MNDRAARGAIVTGYLLGRTRRAKIALMIALWLGGSQFGKGVKRLAGARKARLERFPGNSPGWTRDYDGLPDAASRRMVATVEDLLDPLPGSIRQPGTDVSEAEAARRSTAARSMEEVLVSGNRSSFMGGASRMRAEQADPRDPRKQYPRPKFPAQQQPHPGLDSEMEPVPDYGYDTYRGTGRLRDRVALITGGDSGIGRAVALAFAREGADVAISYLEAEESDASETARVISETGRNVARIPGDIGDRERCQRVVRTAVDEHGRLDILVNNAAYQMSFDGIESIPDDLLVYSFETNIIAMCRLCQAALPHLTEGGTIINVSSIQEYDPSPPLLPYATTKGAIVTFTKGLARELIERGIRVNVVAPGPVRTPIIPASMPAEKTAKFGASAPTGRPAQPAELAPAFVFLASQESSFITGEVLGATGGRLLP